MSSINGTYVSYNSDAKLVVTDGNDSNGSFGGQLTQAGVNYNVTGHYHFQNSTGQPTIIAFTGYNDGHGYVTFAAFSPDHNYGKLRASGSRTTFDGQVVGLGGEFVKQ
ncbi:hypothetical protein [Pseudomonas batumici]|uniref:Transferrin-binding protein B C-lobe/N-lobe beta barrel domain-containing protein n=1 Tax=Pseudomonas batumici TaxID=226910 RepID=A0A0C2EPV4_9PSED|nr:hypothetical protein [Pseudomonas batumici]KIH80534.1 hypothetical protein UCMB321_5743 [Pseudomonas batumici]KIH80623.1 hypothetical protein UCMB321_5654 [Pseudomonas batumici]